MILQLRTLPLCTLQLRTRPLSPAQRRVNPRAASRHRGLTWWSQALLATALLLSTECPVWGQPVSGAVPLGMVSLRITVQRHDAAAPWNKTPERVVRGNALVLKNRLLLTTADLVKNATLIEARKFGRYPSYAVWPYLVDYELDLALLKVDDAAFWKGLKPPPIAKKPVVSGRFAINRWRANGRFERGSGEVVQVQAGTSRFGNLEYAELQGTTTMSGLGWGEVLTLGEEVVGLIASHNRSTLSAINSPMLKRFIRAAGQKPYRGFAHRGFYWQRLNHEALRAFYGFTEEKEGILIRRLMSGGTGAHTLREGDILLKLGPYAIDPEGWIDHPDYGAILFSIAINETLAPTMNASVLRNGKPLKLALKRSLLKEEDYRIRPYRFDQSIDYEVFCGLVIQELSLEYLRLWGKDWRNKAPARLTIEYFLNSLRRASVKKEKVLIVSKVLPDPINIGYAEVSNSILTAINGKTMASLADVRRALAHPQKGYQVLRFNPSQGPGRIVFGAAKVEKANRRIRERYGLPVLRPELAREPGRGSAP